MMFYIQRLSSLQTGGTMSWEADFKKFLQLVEVQWVPKASITTEPNKDHIDF